MGDKGDWLLTMTLVSVGYKWVFGHSGCEWEEFYSCSLRLFTFHTLNLVENDNSTLTCQ